MLRSSMKRVPRLLFASLFGVLAASGAASLAVGCSSFGGDASEQPDAAGTEASADTSTSDAPAPDAATTDAAPFDPRCAIVQLSPDAHVFCADFEDELRTGWRGSVKDSVAWAVALPDTLMLLGDGGPGKPGPQLLQAVTGPSVATSDAGDAGPPNLASGSLTFTSVAQKGFRIEFDLLVATFPLDANSAVTAFDVVLTPTNNAPSMRIYMTLNKASVGGSLVISTSADDVSTKFTAGSQSFVGAWRHVLLEIGGSEGNVRLSQGASVIATATLPTTFPFPASAALRIGLPFYVTGPARLLWDNVTLDARN